MATVQDIQWARRVLRDRHQSLDKFGDAWMVQAAGAKVLVDHYTTAGRHELTPVRFQDAVAQGDDTMRMSDEWLALWRDEAAVGTPAGNASPGGKTPGAVASGRSGSKLRMKLPHAGFYISQSYDEDGNPYVGLFEGPDPNVARGDTMQTGVVDRRTRALFEYQGIRTKAKLQQMNERNRSFWETHQRS